MNSILLKTTDSGEELVMYGFANETQYTKAIYEAEGEIIFSGSKEELLSKEDKFFQEIVKWERYETGEEIYKNYSSYISINFLYPDESIQSALSCLTHNNNILIIKRKR